jgi:hypothetical protein
MSEECNEIDKPWFTPIILLDPNQPVGFETWSQGIKQYKYNVILPDNSKINVKMFIDMNGTFNEGAFTNMLVNRYKDINGI